MVRSAVTSQDSSFSAELEAKARESASLQRELWPAFERTIGKVALEDEARILARFAGVHPGDRVLEVGCGTGRLLAGLSRITPRVFGVDVLTEAVRAARGRGLDVTQANGLHLPFADRTFAFVVVNDVIHNLPSDLTEPFLRELARVGQTVVLGAVRNHLAFGLDLGYLALALRRGRRAEDSAINDEVRTYGALSAVAARCGLSVCGLQPGSHFQALFATSSIWRRLYRIRPGAIGIVGWLLPRPYSWLQYDVLLRRG
jgi:SAM-dependent methyltransferase